MHRPLATFLLATAATCTHAYEPVLRVEAESSVPVRQLVEGRLLSGPGFQVEPEARLVGYQARFVIVTDWGTLEAESVEMLAVRVAEVPAMRALFDAEITALVARQAGGELTAPLRAVGNVVLHPVDAAIGLPVGAMRYFGERVSRWGRRAQRLGDRIDRQISHEGDPFRDPEGPLGATRDDGPSDARAWWERPVAEAGRLVKGEMGYRRSRLELAGRLGIDPYTSNPILNERLDQLAWMTASGRFASRQLVRIATAGFGEALGYTRDVERLVLTASPEDLRARNRDTLTLHCADIELVDRFLGHRPFTPALQTAMVEVLGRLRPSSGCEALLETALMSASEVEARFVLNALRMVEHYGGDSAAGGRILAQGATLGYETPDGGFVLPLPLDVLSWTLQISDWFDTAALKRHDDRTVLVAGRISDLAQRELSSRRWSLVPHLPYPGAPPYARSPALPPTLPPAAHP